jgi:hypothetical protein
MNFDLNEGCSDLFYLEKEILNLSKSDFESSYDHWTLINTLNHVYSWKNGALKKVELRLAGKEAKYHSDESLETINQNIYKMTVNYSKRKTIEVLNETEQKIRAISAKIRNHELSKELAPNDFNGTVFDYLRYDLIYHPINHYLFYAIKNNEYDVFLVVEKFITKYRSVIFNDLGIINLKEFIAPKDIEAVFTKGYEWENDDLFIQIKQITV